MASALKTIADPAVDRYVAAFARRGERLPATSSARIAELRARALARFAASGFPTIREESWKYTDLRRLAQASFDDRPAAEESAIAPERLRSLITEDSAHLVVFVDGIFAPALSSLDGMPDGAVLRPLAHLLAEAPELVDSRLGQVAGVDESGPLAALNTAFMEDGLVLMLEPGISVPDPIQVLWLSRDGAAVAVYPRLLVVAGEGSEVTLVESFAAAGHAAGFTNAVAEVELGSGAHFRHIRLQEESVGAWHVGFVRARIAADASYNGFVVSAGARMARTEIRADLNGKGAECTLDGVTLVRGRQHADVTTDIQHLSGFAQSRQTFKSVLDDRSRSVFQGRVLVAQDAQRTNAHQTNRNLLLSRGAQADSKPELIIHADDVKCSHGATVGDLDRNALFYLRARGIDEITARAMLVEAFVRELIDAAPGANIRRRMERTLSGWLADLAREKEAA